MLRPEQLELFRRKTDRTLGMAEREELTRVHRGRTRDAELEGKSRVWLYTLGAEQLARQVEVEWNPRLRSAAGRANFRARLVSLNPRLLPFGEAEVDRTLRHELAHLLAHARAGRRRIAPHGAEWRQACADFGIADEARTHTLALPVHRRVRRFLYRCGVCGRDFPRTRVLRKAAACLACCRAHSAGQYDVRFRLQLVESAA